MSKVVALRKNNFQEEDQGEVHMHVCHTRSSASVYDGQKAPQCHVEV